MTEDEIKIIWERFKDGFSINQEIENLKQRCELHGCEYASFGSSWCNKKCDLKEMIYILKLKLENLGYEHKNKKEKG